MLSWFKKSAGPTARDLDTGLDAAVGKFRQGDRTGAEKLVHDLTTRATTVHGDDHPLTAKALFNESTILVGMGDFQRGVALLQRAAAIPGRDEQSHKDRMTYQMNLGDILTRAGQIEQAETVLRTSLAERRSFYGERHAGYAYGLESLAETLLARGQADEALSLSSAALDIYLGEQHFRAPAIVAQRAWCAATAGRPDIFPHWDSLPTEIRQEVAGECLGRVEQSPDPMGAVRALEALWDRRAFLPRSLWMQLAAARSNMATLAGQSALRIEATREAAALAEEDGDLKNVCILWQGLALALSDSDPAEVEAAYVQALAAAEKVDAPGTSATPSAVLRNHALWLADQGRHDEAEAMHRRALESARVRGDRLQQGRAETALGIYLQHAGRKDGALELLTSALENLPPSESDAFYAQNHLNALKTGHSCGCGDAATASASFSALLERLVRSRIPDGLLKSIAYEDEGVRVELAREMKSEEAEMLNSAIHLSLAEMRQNYRNAGKAST